MQIPGWRTLDPDSLERAVLKTLASKGFSAVQVLERVRYNPESALGLLISPWANAALYWRSLQPWEAVSWSIWIWLLFGLKRRYARKT